MAAGIRREPGVRYGAFVPNARGAERAIRSLRVWASGLATTGSLRQVLHATGSNYLRTSMICSARAIGAFRVAEAALGLEAAMKTDGDLAGAMARLQETVEEARETIGRMLNRS